MNASKVLSKSQRIFFLLIFIMVILGLIFSLEVSVITILSFLTLFYSANIIFTIYLIVKALFDPQEITFNDRDLREIHDSFWPRYTILCPLYHEANIVSSFIDNMSRLDYPKDRLECILLLEQDDTETLNKVREMNLPLHFKVVIVPLSFPKTKPKACNLGLSLAKGKYIVIYDAEDRPDPKQLKYAVLTYHFGEPDIACVQAKLNFYNPRQNLLTKLFTVEYTLWFDLVLPGLQASRSPIPLGGTSNHFSTKLLRAVGGWDPYNVTEDCDLGIRLSKLRLKTEIIDSTTWEEANPRLGNWLRQRSRWVKGYLQTFLVHSRNPFNLLKSVGWRNFFIIVLMTGFLPVVSLINPFLWLTTISYFVFRPTLGPIIEQFFPPFLLYPAVLCMVVGNFIYFYGYLIASSKKGFERYTKYGLLSGVSWIMISIASWRSIFQLFFKPHFWEKTRHGLSKAGGKGV